MSIWKKGWPVHFLQGILPAQGLVPASGVARSQGRHIRRASLFPRPLSGRSPGRNRLNAPPGPGSRGRGGSGRPTGPGGESRTRSGK
jgi:hypothetical protein